MASVRNCPHCPATWLNHRTKEGDYYCRACKRRFQPPRTVLPPTRPKRARRRSSPTTIKDCISSALTRRIYPRPREED